VGPSVTRASPTTPEPGVPGGDSHRAPLVQP
jgi:hypothetical protein